MGEKSIAFLDDLGGNHEAVMRVVKGNKDYSQAIGEPLLTGDPKEAIGWLTNKNLKGLVSDLNLQKSRIYVQNSDEFQDLLDEKGNLSGLNVCLEIRKRNPSIPLWLWTSGAMSAETVDICRRNNISVILSREVDEVVEQVLDNVLKLKPEEDKEADTDRQKGLVLTPQERMIIEGIENFKIGLIEKLKADESYATRKINVGEKSLSVEELICEINDADSKIGKDYIEGYIEVLRLTSANL